VRDTADGGSNLDDSDGSGDEEDGSEMQERIERHVLSTQQCLDEAATEQARAMTAMTTHIQAIVAAATQREGALEHELRLEKRRFEDHRRREREAAEYREQGKLSFARTTGKLERQVRAATNRADVATNRADAAEQALAEIEQRLASATMEGRPSSPSPSSPSPFEHSGPVEPRLWLPRYGWWRLRLPRYDGPRRS